MSDLGSERDLHCICKLLNARQDSCSAIDAELDLLSKISSLKLLQGLQPHAMSFDADTSVGQY